MCDLAKWYESNKKTYTLTNRAGVKLLEMLMEYKESIVHLEQDDVQVSIGGNFYQNRSGKIKIVNNSYDEHRNVFRKQLQIGSNIVGKQSLELARQLYQEMDKYAKRLHKKERKSTYHRVTIDYDIHSNFCTVTIYVDKF